MDLLTAGIIDAKKQDFDERVRAIDDAETEEQLLKISEGVKRYLVGLRGYITKLANLHRS